MKKIGVITYHAAYNYGSVLQAYATQFAIERLGFKTEIINYRMREQRNAYKLYRTKYGIRPLLKDLMQLSVHKKRIQRINSFENFMTEYMKLTKECVLPKDVYAIWNNYDIIISGSDQIWNKHSLELANNNLEFMKPYLLSGFLGRKISYASSVANMTDEELKPIIPEMLKFSCISMREKSSAERMSLMLEKDVPAVLDPTFLLNTEEWVTRFQIKESNESTGYILYYSLGGIQPLKEISSVLKLISKRKNLKVKVITPFAYLKLDDEVIEMHPEVGPIEFMNLIFNAEMVVTNSYHGTILSVNLRKDIYSLCENMGSDFRKTDILTRIGMQDRIVYNPTDLLEKNFSPINYEKVYDKLEYLRKQSLHYLDLELSGKIDE